MEQFKLAISHGPKECPAREHLAIVLTDYGTRLKLAGSVEKAVHLYNEALQVHPSYCPALFNLAVVYSERRAYDLAMKYYQMAIEYNPNYVEALCNVGVLCLKVGTRVIAKDATDSEKSHLKESSLPIEEVRPSAHLLLSEIGSNVPVMSVRRNLHSRRMYEIIYEDGRHTVTPEHLVTLRWKGRPRVTLTTTNRNEQILLLIWTNRYTLLEEHQSWRWELDQAAPGDLLQHVDTLPPHPSHTHLDRLRLAAFAWLRFHSQSNPSLAPLYDGDLFDVSADRLARLLKLRTRNFMIDMVDLPMVRTQPCANERSEPTIEVVDQHQTRPIIYVPQVMPNAQSGLHFSALADNTTRSFDTVYILSSRDASSIPYALLQLQRAWDAIRLDIDEANIAIMLPSFSSPSPIHSIAIDQLLNAALTLRPRTIVHLSPISHDHGGNELLFNATKQLSQIIDVARAYGHPTSDRTHFIAAIDGIPQPLAIHLAPHPAQGHRIHQLIECMVHIHRSSSFDPLPSVKTSSRLLEVDSVDGGEYVSVEVGVPIDSLDGEGRFVLADGIVSHNCKNSGELALSIEYYERALRANPNFAIANSNLSIACTDMGTQVKNEGRLDEGIAYYKRALHHHSKYPAAWYNLVSRPRRQ